MPPPRRDKAGVRFPTNSGSNQTYLEGSGKRSETIETDRQKQTNSALGKVKLFEPGKKRKPYEVPYYQRLRGAVCTFIFGRYDGCPVWTDDGEMYVPVLLPLYVQEQREKGHEAGWARRKTQEMVPLLVESDEWWREQERLASRRGSLKPDWIAEQIKITEPELKKIFKDDGRRRCGLVGTDRPLKLRKADRKADQAARKKAKRRTYMQPREMSDSVTKPWIAAGFNNRRTWQRHGKPRVQGSDVQSLSNIPPVGRGTEPNFGHSVPSSGIVSKPRNEREGWEGFEKAWQAQLAALQAAAEARWKEQGIVPNVRTEPVIAPRRDWALGFWGQAASRRQVRGCVERARRGSPGNPYFLARQVPSCASVEKLNG